MFLWQHQHHLPATVWLQTRSVPDGGGESLHRGSEEADGVQEPWRPGGRLWCHHPGCCVQGGDRDCMCPTHTHSLPHIHCFTVFFCHAQTLIYQDVHRKRMMQFKSLFKLTFFHFPVTWFDGFRSRSVGGPVLPTFWSSPPMLRLTWLWMVVSLGSCSPTTGCATWTQKICTACLPPWLVCAARVCSVCCSQETATPRERNRENERVCLNIQDCEMERFSAGASHPWGMWVF